MAQFGASIQTAQVTTGSFFTTVDPFVSGFAGYPNNPGQRNPLGSAYYDSTGSFSGVTASSPYGNMFGPPLKTRYVHYSSTSNPVLTNATAPFPVYWTDATYTSVTPVATESLTGGINCLAGLCLPNTTAITTLTNVILNTSFVWIAVGGYVPGVKGFTAMAADDTVIGSTTSFSPGRVAAGTASTNRVIGYAQSALGTPSAGLINILVTLES